ncbi:MAG: energy-dependent translational throttle protein EttA [Spirochaetia bacterium]|nr:energy-dependent translational throttle protein EttA [Spirochaetia bacterium]
MAERIIYTMKRLRKVYPPKKEIIRELSLSFYAGAKIGVIGSNGSGKSTLLKIMAGLDTQFDGEAFCDKGTKIGFLPQEPTLDPKLSVVDNIKQGMKETMDLLKRFEDLSAKMGEELPEAEMNKVMDQFAETQEKIEKAGAWEVERQLEIAMDALRVPSDAQDVTKLSGGERRRVALCRLLLENPDMLIIDEPTNHLDAESVEWLEIFLKNFTGTVVAVTHDRYFLDHVAEWILELDRGEAYPFKGNYTSWLEQKRERLRVEEKSEGKRQQTLDRELEWIRAAPKARHTKSAARVQAYESLLSQETRKIADALEIQIPAGERLGNDVIEFKNVSKGYGDTLLLDGFSCLIPPGAIVGIIGPNGAGKTTLFQMVAGRTKPDKGEVVIGKTVQLAYVDQMRDDLENNKTVWENISGGLEEIPVGSRIISSRAYVGSFNFKGPEQQKKVGDLSGGERNRVHLAKLLRRGGNVLLLDEPTNDLDVDTLRALEEALEYFAGCIMIISHDRYFLDRIATHTISFEGDSRAVFFKGNYSDYEEYKRKTLGEGELQPKRLKYKTITR